MAWTDWLSNMFNPAGRTLMNPTTPSTPTDVSGGGGNSSGFMDKASSWLADPRNQLALAQLGKGLSGQQIVAGHVMNTPGANIADAIIPGLQGQITHRAQQSTAQSQAKASDALNANSGPLSGVTIGGQPASVFASPHVTGITERKPDGTTVSIKSPGPTDYANADVINRQISAGQLPSAASPPPTTGATPSRVSEALGNQSPFVTSQSGAGNSGLDLTPVVSKLESGGRDYNADGTPLTSPKGAKYAMQVMPSTAAKPGYGIQPAQSDTPEEYNRVGREYLAALQQKYGDQAKTLAAYNAGPTAVDSAIAQYGDQWLSHMPMETQAYVGKIGPGSASGTAMVNPSATLIPAPMPTAAPPSTVPISPYLAMNNYEPRGLTPEQVLAATDSGMKLAHAPFANTLTAAQAENLRTETEAKRLGMPTQRPVIVDIPGVGQVTVSAADALKYQEAMSALQMRQRELANTSALTSAQAGYYGARAQIELSREKAMQAEESARSALVDMLEKSGAKFADGTPMGQYFRAFPDAAKSYLPGLMRQQTSQLRIEAMKEIAEAKNTTQQQKDAIGVAAKANKGILSRYAPTNVLLEANGKVNWEAMRGAESEMRKRAEAGDVQAVNDSQVFDRNIEYMKNQSPGSTQTPTATAPVVAPTTPTQPKGVPEGYHKSNLMDPRFPGVPIWIDPVNKKAIAVPES